MKKQLNQTKNIVLEILEVYPETRSSDNLLYLTVIEALGKGNSDKPISTILLNLKEMGLPCFETVRRTRQKIQEERSDLQANDTIYDFRSEREMEFREYFGTKCHD